MKLDNIINPDTNAISNTEPAEGIKSCLVRLYLDYSTSMLRTHKAVFNAVKETLEALADKNNEAIDCEFLTQIILVGDEVKLFNDEPLDPAQILEIFDEDDYKLEGSTQISKWLKHFDHEYSRSSGFPQKVKEYGYKVYNLMFTDFCATDDPATRNKALDSLKDNIYYRQLATTLCVFFGTEASKKEAEIVAGSADNVIAISGDLINYLAPMVIGSTITLADATHINTGTTTNAETAKKAMDNYAYGASGANSTKISPDEIAKMMDDILKSTK